MSGPDKIVQATPELSRFSESKVAQNKPLMVFIIASASALHVCPREGVGDVRGDRRRLEETGPGVAGGRGTVLVLESRTVQCQHLLFPHFAAVSLGECLSVTITLANKICL